MFFQKMLALVALFSVLVTPIGLAQQSPINKDVSQLTQSLPETKVKEVEVKVVIGLINTDKINQLGYSYSFTPSQGVDNSVAHLTRLENQGQPVSKRDHKMIEGLNTMALNKSVELPDFLHILDSLGLAEIEEEPRLVTSSGEESCASVATTYYDVVPGLTLTGLQRLNMLNNYCGRPITWAFPQEDLLIGWEGTRIKTTPWVLSDGRIRLSFGLQRANLRINSNSEVVGPSQTVQTESIFPNHGNMVLGGLGEERTENKQRVVPGLHRLPLIGGMFRGPIHTIKTKRDIIIVVKASILEKEKSVSFLVPVKN